MVEQYLVTSQIIFSCMVGACTAAKGRQSRFIRGYSICGLSSNHKNHEYSPLEITSYTVLLLAARSVHDF